MTNRRDFIKAASAVGFGATGFAQIAKAQEVKAAKILVGFPPGGTSDALSRRLADKLQGRYAPTVIVENKPGAGSQIAVTALRDSPTDGSVMLVVPSSALAIYPFTYPKLPYKPLVDVQPVSLACTFNHGFAVGPAVPESVKSFKDYVAWAKANPGAASYGSPAAGSMPHMVAALAAMQSGVALNHVPYRGSAPGLQDMLGGQISAMSAPLGEFLAHIKGGKIRVLAISGTKRSRFLPDVPTFQEQGLQITSKEWFGVFMPVKTPSSVIQGAAAHLQKALAEPDVIKALGDFGMEAESSTPQQLEGILKADFEEWRAHIKKLGFTMET